MENLVLYVGTKSISSWSLRPYLVLARLEVPFEERVIELDQPDTKQKMLAISPSGRVPVLHHGKTVVWDSLAICEYLADLFPDQRLWPTDRAARALARSISCEMHAGFPAMRRHFSMDLLRSHAGEGHVPEALADAARVMDIWRSCRARATGGPFLFGHFTIADAMFAPVTTRFTTYAVPMDPVCQAYCDAIAELPAMQTWVRTARPSP